LKIVIFLHILDYLTTLTHAQTVDGVMSVSYFESRLTNTLRNDDELCIKIVAPGRIFFFSHHHERHKSPNCDHEGFSASGYWYGVVWLVRFDPRRIVAAAAVENNKVAVAFSKFRLVSAVALCIARPAFLGVPFVELLIPWFTTQSQNAAASQAGSPKCKHCFVFISSRLSSATKGCVEKCRNPIN
jgi:hypothetical protein